MFLKPATKPAGEPALQVFDPALNNYLPAYGRNVGTANELYWSRRLQFKEVVEMDPKTALAEIEKAEQAERDAAEQARKDAAAAAEKLAKETAEAEEKKNPQVPAPKSETGSAAPLGGKSGQQQNK